jgi:hypothetical protein
MNGDNPPPAVLPVAAISALALAGVAVWAWLALVDSRQAMNSLDALDGMHFDK